MQNLIQAAITNFKATFGLACDNLLAAKLVLADGRQVTASATENPDLFWAIRGGGGNFGIVTTFVFRLHPVGPTVLGGMVLYPVDQAKAVLHFYRDFYDPTNFFRLNPNIEPSA